MEPYWPAVALYVLIGVEIKALEFARYGIEETPVKFNEISRTHLANALALIDVHAGKYASEREVQPANAFIPIDVHAGKDAFEREEQPLNAPASIVIHAGNDTFVREVQ